MDDFDEMEDVLSEHETFLNAVRKNNLEEATRCLSNHQHLNIDKPTTTSKTALFLALENKNVAMVKLLLWHGADVNLVSYCQTYSLFETPITTATRLQHSELIELFLMHGCQMEYVASPSGKSALQWAATYGDIYLADMFILHGADINWIGPYLHTALHYATIAEQPSMVLWLLQHGAKPSVNGDGRSPLHIAAVHGSVRTVEHLLNYGCIFQVRDNFNFMPFSLACLRGHISVIKLFVDKVGKQGVDINDGLHRATETGCLEVIQYLFDHGAEINSRNSVGETALSIASSRGQYQSILVLLELGAEMNTIDSRNYSPLLLSMMREHIDIVKTLIIHGADVTSAHRLAKNPLKMAFTFGNPIIIKYFIMAGCPVYHEPWFNVTTIESRLRESEFSISAPMRFNKETKIIKETWNWLKMHVNSPKSLKEVARIAVRQQMLLATHGKSILNEVEMLPIPKAIQSYVILNNIVTE